MFVPLDVYAEDGPFIYLLKYNTMVPHLNLKSTLTCEGEIHTKGKKLNMYSIYYAKQQ